MSRSSCCGLLRSTTLQAVACDREPLVEKNGEISYGRLPGSSLDRLRASHSFTMEPLLDARRRLSGLKATLVTSLVCPRRVLTSWPVSASHTFTGLSSLSEARRRPSGL